MSRSGSMFVGPPGLLSLEPAEDVWLHTQLQTRVHPFDPGEMPGLRDLEEVEIAVPPGPLRGLGLSPDEPLEIHAERFHAVARPQRRERDPDLGGPAGLGDVHFGPPPLVPLQIDVLPFVGDQRVVLRPERIDREVERVAVIVEGIEHHLEAVIVEQRIVAPHLAGDDAVTFRVEAGDADIQVRRVQQDAHFGSLRHWLANARLLLDEIADHLRLLPFRLAERSVHAYRRGHGERAHRLGRRGACGRLRVDDTRHCGREQQRCRRCNRVTHSDYLFDPSGNRFSIHPNSASSMRSRCLPSPAFGPEGFQPWSAPSILTIDLSLAPDSAWVFSCSHT